MFNYREQYIAAAKELHRLMMKAECGMVGMQLKRMRNEMLAMARH